MEVFQTLLTILYVHFIVDYGMQPRSWAETKHGSFRSLLKHTYTYAFLLTIAYGWYTNFDLTAVVLTFWLLFITHTIIDLFSSKAMFKLYNDKNWYAFWLTHAADQFGHIYFLVVLVDVFYNNGILK